MVGSANILGMLVIQLMSACARPVWPAFRGGLDRENRTQVPQHLNKN